VRLVWFGKGLSHSLKVAFSKVNAEPQSGMKEFPPSALIFSVCDVHLRITPCDSSHLERFFSEFKVWVGLLESIEHRSRRLKSLRAFWNAAAQSTERFEQKPKFREKTRKGRDEGHPGQDLRLHPILDPTNGSGDSLPDAEMTGLEWSDPAREVRFRIKKRSCP
jgi:hypothetical protein